MPLSTEPRPLIQLRLRAEEQPKDTISFARAIVECARERAAQISKEIEETRTAAYRAGREDGFDEGVRSLSKELEDVARLRMSAIEEVRNSITEIIVALTEELLGECIKNQPQALETRVKKAIALIDSEHELRIYLHPADAERVRFPDSSSIVPDSSISPGSAQLRNANGVWEISPERRLAKIRELLRNES